MSYKRNIHFIVLLAVLISSLSFAGPAKAAYNCSAYITVQWGDTLSGIAALCGTTVADIQAANPGVGWWIYSGQVLYIPTGGYQAGNYYPAQDGNYVIQSGDTLANIALRTGVSVNDILAANPNIWNASWIYAGQVITLPYAPSYYTVQNGDTMRTIAAWYGTSVYSLQALNPQIYNTNWIYAGQVIRIR